MVKTMKKVFSSFVAFMTIFSSVSFGALGFANVASAASAGDLLKASGPAVYYYAQDGKRYVFPNEKTYFSWYNDFSSVQTISDAELAAIPIGGNVTIRPGTKLVKIQTDPKTYAVTRCGTIHWIESEAIAKQLYGDNWNQRIVDVPDAFFVNYTVGSSLSTAVHPDGQLVKYDGDSNYYVVWNGQKRKFNPASALDANMENTANAVMTTISYPDGADVTGYEADLGDVVCAGAPVGSELTVKLASDTPAGITVPKNSASVPLAKFALMGGDAATTINTLTIHRVGVGAASDFSNVYLYDGAGKRLTTGRSINSTSHTATFSSLNISVPANSTVYLYVYGDFSSPSTTGGQHAIEISDAGSVALDGSSTVNGTFPVRGNTFTVGTSLAGRLDVQKGTTPSNPNVGSKDAPVSSFKLTANTNDIMVNQITLYQAGSINNTDLSNLKLYQGSDVVGTGDAVTSDGRIVLKFNPSYLIKSGTTKIFTLKADVAGRASRTIKTYVEYTTDVNATDQVFSAGAAVCIADTAVGGCTTTGQGSFDGDEQGTSATTDDNLILVTTQGGTLTRAFNGPPTSNVAKGKLGVKLYNFALTAENTVEIRNIGFSIDKTTGSGCFVKGSSGTNYFRNIKVMDTDSGVTKMGPTEFASGLSSSATGSGTLTLSDSFNIEAGKTVNLAIAADLSNSEDATGEFFGNNNCGYKVTLNAFGSTDVRIVETGEFLATAKIVPNDALVGNELTVKSSSLSVALAGTPSSQTVVKKQQNLPVAGLVFTSGAQSDVLITDITLTCQAKLANPSEAFGDSTALADCDQRVTKLSLWKDGVMIGTPKAPDTTTGGAQISNLNLTVPAGSSVTLTAAADLSSTASTTSPYDQVAVGIAADADIQAQDDDANTVTASRSAAVEAQSDGASPSVVVTIRNSGEVTYNTGSNPVSTIIVAGQDAWVPFAQYKASAQFEAISLDRIAVESVSTSAGTTHNADNSIYTAVAVAVNGAIMGQDVFSAGTTGTKDIDLTANPITIPKDGSTTFELWAKLSGVQSSSSVSGATTGVHRSGMQPSLTLDNSVVTGEWDSNYYSSTNIRATGDASGERVYASSTNITDGNVMVTRATKPIVTKQNLSSTTLANIDQDILKFNVAADSAGSVALKQIMFSVTQTGLTSLSNFRVRKGTTDVALGNVAFTGFGGDGSACGDAGDTSDLETGSMTSSTCTVVMSFTNEEVISGSGNTYTLHATIAGATSGDSLSVSFYRDSSTDPVVTGYLQASVAHGQIPSSSAIFNIDTATAPAATVNATGTFVWSDNSEVPHSDADGGSAGSRDWTNDVYVEDISQTQNLSL